jgi:hypothetical protein
MYIRTEFILFVLQRSSISSYLLLLRLTAEAGLLTSRDLMLAVPSLGIFPGQFPLSEQSYRV